MILSGELFNPSQLAGYCWDLMRPAVMLGGMSAAASLSGRLLSLPPIVSRVPTFARLLTTSGAVLLGAPVLAWGINATVTLILFLEVMYSGQDYPMAAQFLSYFLVLPVSGVAALAVDQVSVRLSKADCRPIRLLDAVILAMVVQCWILVLVVAVLMWEG